MNPICRNCGIDLDGYYSQRIVELEKEIDNLRRIIIQKNSTVGEICIDHAAHYREIDLNRVIEDCNSWKAKYLKLGDINILLNQEVWGLEDRIKKMIETRDGKKFCDCRFHCHCRCQL